MYRPSSESGHALPTIVDARDDCNPTVHEAVAAMCIENRRECRQRLGDPEQETYSCLATHRFFSFAHRALASATSRSRTPSVSGNWARELIFSDTLSMFGESFESLRDLAAKVLQQLPAKTRREFQQLRSALFKDKSLMVSAAAIVAATGRAHSPSAETIEAVCTVGLESIFAP